MNLCINVCMVYEVLNVPIDIDSCKPNPCPNGAICKNDEGSYSCLCPEGFEGDACDGKLPRDAFFKYRRSSRV